MVVGLMFSLLMWMVVLWAITGIELFAYVAAGMICIVLAAVSEVIRR